MSPPCDRDDGHIRSPAQLAGRVKASWVLGLEQQEAYGSLRLTVHPPDPLGRIGGNLAEAQNRDKTNWRQCSETEKQ
jgi:hypothetical protein